MTENRKRKHSPTVLPPMPSDDVNTEIDDVEMIDDLEIEKNVPKKKSAKKNIPDEAQAAKQEAAKLKRQKVKVMAEASSVMSLDVLHADSITAERNQTAIDIATIKADLKTVADNQEKLIALIEPLLESVQCNQCLKSMYKGIKRSSLKSKSQSPSQSVSQSVLQSPSQAVSRAPLQSVSQTPTQSISRAPLQSVSQTPTQSMSRAPLQSVSQTPTQSMSRAPLQSVSQSPSQAEAVSRAPLQSVLQAPLPSQSPLQSVSKSPSQSLGKVFDMSILEENDVGAEEGNELPPIENPDDLVYLGETGYGVKMRKNYFDRCIEQSGTPEKLGLNLLEFLVSVEDCQNMTVYGQGKQKKMPKNIRRAIRSQIFARFMKDKTEEEKTKFWMDKIVYKLNDKIRGIRNGKYNSTK